MYCSNCGLKGAGNFCTACGTRFQAGPDGIPSGDWRHEVRYDVLVQHPEVRDRIARSAAGSGKAGMTGEEWLGLFDKAFSPMTGVSLKTVATIAAPIYAKMGVQTGKARTESFVTPIGEAIVEVLCSLARAGITITDIHQGDAGCVFEAKLPSDLWSFEGKLVVTIERVATKTRLQAVTTIPGQLFDWGKSGRCLDRLFADLCVARAA
ncbi:MAG: hypothetical protein U0746_15250 [Gemmataceae bacterium]